MAKTPTNIAHDNKNSVMTPVTVTLNKDFCSLFACSHSWFIGCFSVILWLRFRSVSFLLRSGDLSRVRSIQPRLPRPPKPVCEQCPRFLCYRLHSVPTGWSVVEYSDQLIFCPTAYQASGSWHKIATVKCWLWSWRAISGLIIWMYVILIFEHPVSLYARSPKPAPTLFSAIFQDINFFSCPSLFACARPPMRPQTLHRGPWDSQIDLPTNNQH